MFIQPHLVSSQFISFHLSPCHLTSSHLMLCLLSIHHHISSHLIPCLLCCLSLSHLFSVGVDCSHFLPCHLSFSHLIAAHLNSSLFSFPQRLHSSQFFSIELFSAFDRSPWSLGTLFPISSFLLSVHLIFQYLLLSLLSCLNLLTIASHQISLPSQRDTAEVLRGQQSSSGSWFFCAVRNDACSQSSAATMASSKPFKIACNSSTISLRCFAASATWLCAEKLLIMHGMVSAAHNGAPVLGTLEAEADAGDAGAPPVVFSYMLPRRSTAVLNHSGPLGKQPLVAPWCSKPTVL